VTDNKQFI